MLVLNFVLGVIYGETMGPLHSTKIRNEMNRLYLAYVKPNSSFPTSSGQQESSFATTNFGFGSSNSGEASKLTSIAMFKKQQMNQIGSSADRQRTELDKYFAEDLEADEEGFDVLNWWKVNAARLPTLSAMAKDVLAVPISTVASECAFSTSGRVLSDFRSSLTSKTVEALICAQDWLRPRGEPTIQDDEDLDDLTQLEIDAEEHLNAIPFDE